MARNRRFKAEGIPTSSMADIAFLLLVFFLVTTTIDTDKGLGIVLPPPGDMEIEIRKENILNCLINSQGKVLLDEEPISIDQIHRVVGQKLRANDKLIVSVTSDEFVNKGPNRPAFNSRERLEAISSLGVVDYVVLSSDPTAINTIKELKEVCKEEDMEGVEDLTEKLNSTWQEISTKLYEQTAQTETQSEETQEDVKKEQ